MIRLVVALAVVSGCSKHDDCGELYDKLTSAWPSIMPMLGLDGSRDEWVPRCRKEVDQVREVPILKCVLAATGDDAVKKCITDEMFHGDERPDVKSDVQLMNLGTPAKQAYRQSGAFPKGHAGPTPSKSCCSYPDHQCPVSQEWAADPIWRALGIAITEPTFAQFRYDSDGTSVVLSATYDEKCSGQPVTSKSKLEVAADGTLTQHWADDHH